MPANSIDDRETCDNLTPVASQPLPTGVTPGARVMMRGRPWTLEAVLPHADCHELHVVGGSPPGRCVLLWPFDRPEAADAPARFRSVRLRAWAARVGHAIADDVDPGTPRARVRAVRILPYQLAPAVAMAAGTPRILLADEVGLGKTIQAGWIVGDLVAREPAARILIAVPAGLRRQWRAELTRGFDLQVHAVDAGWLRAAVAAMPADISPWTAPGVYLGSIDFLKRSDVAASLAAHVWDLLVVDEAHTAASPTERYVALAAVAGRARRVALITATPYSGDTAGFASMAALGGVTAEPPPVMFRRSREDVGDPRRRRHRFAAVHISAAEHRLQRLLERYSREVWRDAPGNVEGARLAMTILRKRALSSPAAAVRSLRRRLELLRGLEIALTGRQLTLFDEEDDAGDELSDAALAAPGLADAALEQRWLARLVEAAAAAADVDSKQRRLARLLACLGGEPVIVFTEYRDTLLQLAAVLPRAVHLHGGLTAAERAAVQARFNETGGLLLATDAAAEGLNLQRRCRIVINYELPWNPARLEQRIGRVDRIGQERPVHAITLVARDTAEDLVIANLARRLARVVATLGEKDRLGAFLTEARTARLVMAGTGDDLVAADLPICFSPADPAADEARAAAERLSLGQRLAGVPAAIERRRGETIVSTCRASQHLPGGFVIAIDCTARTADGEIVARRLVIVHLPAAAGRPPTRSAGRALAARTLTTLPGDGLSLPAVAAWFANVARIHQQTIDRRLGREAALHSRLSRAGAVQPGLFDRRALRAAEELSAADEAVQAEHSRHLAALDRARGAVLSVTPAAVLIVWH